MFIRTICILYAFVSLLYSEKAHSTYYSQNSQDRILNETFFQGKRKGTFVDIGAYDGKTISNTYFYERELKWKGICVEPLPKAYSNLVKNRKCKTLNCAVGGKNSVVQFFELDSDKFSDLAMLSGVLSNFSSDSIDHYENVLAFYNGNCRIFDVQMRMINDILEENQLYKIDLLSMDIEGGELEVLRSLDFSRFKIHIMLIENNEREKNTNIIKFMESKNFKFVMRLEQDEVYENLNF